MNASKVNDTNAVNTNLDVASERFAGAEVIICESGRRPVNPGSDLVLETSLAAEVSELIFKLKAIFAEQLDHMNKYAFYPSLVRAAKAYQYAYGDNPGILLAIVEEAKGIAVAWGKPLYFAYGSNMDKQQMQERCPGAVFGGLAVLHEFLFELDSAGAATVGPHPESFVLGSIWLLGKEDEDALDRYEGVASGCYEKSYLEVWAQGRPVKALVYVSLRDVYDGKSRCGGDYMRNIICAAEAMGISGDCMETMKQYAS